MQPLRHRRVFMYVRGREGYSLAAGITLYFCNRVSEKPRNQLFFINMLCFCLFLVPIARTKLAIYTCSELLPKPCPIKPAAHSDRSSSLSDPMPRPPAPMQRPPMPQRPVPGAPMLPPLPQPAASASAPSRGAAKIGSWNIGMPQDISNLEPSKVEVA